MYTHSHVLLVEHVNSSRMCIEFARSIFKYFPMKHVFAYNVRLSNVLAIYLDQRTKSLDRSLQKIDGQMLTWRHNTSIVDQAILVRIQNQNEILLKLVIELQADNAQQQSQLSILLMSNNNILWKNEPCLVVGAPFAYYCGSILIEVSGSR